MTDESVSRELAAAQKRVMRAWTKLEQERENLINSLREVEHEMTAMNPVVKALLRSPKNLRPLSSIHKPIKWSTGASCLAALGHIIPSARRSSAF